MGNNKLHKLLKRPSSKLIDELAKTQYYTGNNCPYQYIYSEIKDGKNKDFRNLLNCVANQKAELLCDYNYVISLHKFCEYKKDWIRDISSWKKKSRSRDRQFRELADHLFVKYDMPKFMYNAWFWNGGIKFEGNPIRWFIDIGVGKNIRKSKTPIPLTKKMAHAFMQSPDDFLPMEAIRYGQIVDMGGDMRSVKGVMSTKIASDFGNNEFWNSVLRFFINNPMLDPEKYNPIVDYINHIKYETRRVFQNNVFVTLAPDKPNFNMKDRNPDALLQLVDKWHNQTNRVSRKGVPKLWQPLPINNYVWLVGKDENKMTYLINQLTTSGDILDEGRYMKHCVSSYINSCSGGRTSIWSLNVNSKTKLDSKLLTIEVNSDRVVTQIRGKNNRLPSKYELNIINKWAFKERLTLSRWVSF